MINSLQKSLVGIFLGKRLFVDLSSFLGQKASTDLVLYLFCLWNVRFVFGYLARYLLPDLLTSRALCFRIVWFHFIACPPVNQGHTYCQVPSCPNQFTEYTVIHYLVQPMIFLLPCAGWGGVITVWLNRMILYQKYDYCLRAVDTKWCWSCDAAEEDACHLVEKMARKNRNYLILLHQNILFNNNWSMLLIN